MKTAMAAAIIAAGVLCVPVSAGAQERVGDGAMGAAAGALAFGPVGLLAGGLTGYFAGPNISRGLGFHHHHNRRRHYSGRDKSRAE